jgi:hypothetical protein
MNLPVLIHTFNGYNWLWQGCIDGWKQASLPDNIPLYWGTDIETEVNHDFWRFNLLYSGVGNWSDRLVRLLQKIETKYVFYAQEDHWPVKSVPNLGKMMDLVVKNDLLRLQVAPITKYYKVKKGNSISYFEPDSKYLVSHQPSIWDRKFFLKQITYGETPWINEYEGSKRLKFDPEILQKIAIYDANWFHHACVKGKFIPIQS